MKTIKQHIFCVDFLHKKTIKQHFYFDIIYVFKVLK